MNEELKRRAKRCSDSSVTYNFMQGVVSDLLAECERQQARTEELNEECVDLSLDVTRKVHRIAELESLAARAPSVPDGWKLVPIEATPEMLAVKASPMLVVGSPDNSRVQQWRAGIYAAMLAAAPEAPKP